MTTEPDPSHPGLLRMVRPPRKPVEKIVPINAAELKSILESVPPGVEYTYNSSNGILKVRQLPEDRSRDIAQAVPEMTQTYLQSLLHYNPEAGVFTWITDRAKRKGTEAGTPNTSGYRMITFQGKGYQASRLAWLYMTGSNPIGRISYRNKDKHDLRFSNLYDESAPVSED